MQIDDTKTSLVIAGSWNPAILTPQWIANKVLGLPTGQEFNVEVEMVMTPHNFQKYKYNEAIKLKFE